MVMVAQQTLSKEALRQMETDVLVVLAQQSKRLALEVLVERHQRLVFLALSQLLPEKDDISDLAQEALLRMCRSIGTLRNPKTFKYWLNRIITNLFYDELRKRPRQLQTFSLDQSLQNDEGDSGLTLDVVDTKPLPDAVVLASELDTHIHKAIQNLPEPFRTVIVLRELQGLSYEEIASLTDSTLGTVKSRIARSRFRLQEALAPYIKTHDLQQAQQPPSSSHPLQEEP
jgi:RNA polymerase sigma-70 factor, ECF subfamily